MDGLFRCDIYKKPSQISLNFLYCTFHFFLEFSSFFHLLCFFCVRIVFHTRYVCMRMFVCVSLHHCMCAGRVLFECMYFRWLNLSSEIILNIYRDKTYNSWKSEILYWVCGRKKKYEQASERTIEWTNDAFIRLLLFFLVMSRARQHDEPKFEESHSSKDKLLGYNKRVRSNWLHLSNELGISHECKQAHSEWHMQPLCDLVL